MISDTSFEITYIFHDETHETEVSMLVDGNNIMAFNRNGEVLTTRWDLEEIALWLRDFIDNMAEDPYPVETEGEFAAMKDISARDFDSDDDAEFDAYYDKLDEWNLRHRWHHLSNGAILADLYFQLIGDNVEISWNNTDAEDDVEFLNKLGGVRVNKNVFYSKVNDFLIDYAHHWYD